MQMKMVALYLNSMMKRIQMTETENDVSLKKLIEVREKTYLQFTQKILEFFLPQFNQSVKRVLYDDNDIDILIKGVYPLIHNLNYVTIVAKVAQYSVGTTVPLLSPEGEIGRDVEITKENYWDLADTITIHIPISVLETQDTETIEEFMREVKNEDLEIPPEGEAAVGSTKSSEAFDESKLDSTQKQLLGLYNTKGSKH